MTKTAREYLNDYTRASRTLELQGAAITILESCHPSTGAARAIAALERDQQVQLKRLDHAAAQLGAPYPKA